MAKIDFSKIEGYAEMTAEQKLAALENYEFDDKAVEYSKLKQAFDAAASDAASWKHKYQSTLDEQTRAAAEKEEADKLIRDELESLRKDKQYQGYKAQFLETGYGKELAEESAQAMVDGDTNRLFQNLQTFITENAKSIEAKAMNRQPGLTPGEVPSKQMMEEAEKQKLRSYFGL